MSHHAPRVFSGRHPEHFDIFMNTIERYFATQYIALAFPDFRNRAPQTEMRWCPDSDSRWIRGGLEHNGDCSIVTYVHLRILLRRFSSRLLTCNFKYGVGDVDGQPEIAHLLWMAVLGMQSPSIVTIIVIVVLLAGDTWETILGALFRDQRTIASLRGEDGCAEE
ncbi:hypothetical protein C8R43DRAFT_948021 [Mycena crocata]|nr:hypothetical protein C8R43DRAFT_948021 [Mycena crocata]